MVPRMSMPQAALLDEARAWADQDPDPQTRAELAALIERASSDPHAAGDLADRFAGRLEFGTAGLRGELGAGPHRMNRVVVAQAAAGLAAYLLAHPVEGQAGVVIGYDARHNSDVFARDTAQIMAGAGVPASLLPGPLPTPVLAYAIRHLGTAAGVMVTASHNPPRDNGYKVYLGDGSQIVPPADAAIAAQIEAAAARPVATLARSDDWHTLDDSVVQSYVRAVAALPSPQAPRDLVIAHTSLHGVGAQVVRRVLAATGFGPAHEAPSQAEPDPDFPTVAFPNPEEPGAIDAGIATAREVGADVLVANDPDADRCAVAVPGPDGWRMLRGDEVGVLLADHLLRQGVRARTRPPSCPRRCWRSSRRRTASRRRRCSPASSGSAASRSRLRLRGGARLCRRAAHRRDKDGISALVRVCELAAMLKAQGRTLLDRLDDLAREYGVHATDQLSMRVSDLSLIGEAMARLRSTPPTTLGGLSVEAVDDLAVATAALPATEGLRFRLAHGARVVVRPSGTEPKLKCYLEVVVTGDGSPAAARSTAAGRLTAMRADLARALGM
jgi:phosphomannomutase